MTNAPKPKVSNIRRVHGDGLHNAFTDLCWFQGRIYLTFRTCPEGHMVHNSSFIRILRSEDGNDWEQVGQFSVPDRDTRDPHFLVFQNKLFVYSGAWRVVGEGEARNINDHLGFCVWTEDGDAWSEPVTLEGTYGHYIWRAVEADGCAYLCGRRKKDFVESTGPEGGEMTQAVLLKSENGLVWHFHSVFRQHYGDETAFAIESDGSMIALARTLINGGGNACLCRARPPYLEWAETDLGRYVGGPMICKWGDRTLIGGRRIVDGVSATMLYWLVDKQLVEAAKLPSGGDNSYTGFVPRDDHHGLLSYYSSHESTKKNEASIYLADLEVE
ncbi:MAG: hypothetical protein KAI66_18580 [Lentisphaeria bacterium]|nr:hypothetical protein [Lentisphaeria bacterium]